MWATILQVANPACAWCRHASTKYPDVGLRVLNYYAKQDHKQLEVVEMKGPRWPSIVDDIRVIQGVDEVEVLESSPEEARVRIAATQCALPHAVEASGVVPQLPFEVSGGCDKWLLLTEKEQAKAFYEALGRTGVEIKVTYSGEYIPTAALTERQQEVLAAAVKHGYYDYPRRITLTQLAEKLDIAKSTLSQSLAMTESEVMRAANPLHVRGK